MPARHQNVIFLTITAPPNAEPGTTVPFRVVGRARDGEKTIERVSYPLSWMYSSDTGFFRVAPQSRAAVASPNGPWLESTISELTIKQGDNATIPVRVHGGDDINEMPLVVNIATGIKCNLGNPVTLPVRNGIASVPLTATDKLPIGTFYVTVAQTWRSDIRIGMPGPCTSAIPIHVKPR